MQAIVMTPHFHISILLPVLFGVMALFFLVIGLRGWISNKPFVISSRWLLILVVLGVSPAMFHFAVFPRPIGEPGMLVALRLLVPVMLIVVLIFLYFTLRGYTAFGVTATSFREGLLHSLTKLNLPYEETLSAVKLPTLGADLQVAVQSWVGTAQLTMKKRQSSAVLSDVVKGMNQYYQSGAVSKVNFTCCIFYTVIGAFLSVLAGIFLLGSGKIF
jgi:hypothetical protein